MKRRIARFSQDEEGDWVAHLACGHRQHVRHNPPWIERPWVTTAEGRARVIGQVLACKACDEEAPANGPAPAADAPSQKTSPSSLQGTR